jgi:hypothetical protein
VPVSSFYDPDFFRTRAHNSNLHRMLARGRLRFGPAKRYVFVGSNSTGKSAFFVRDDFQHDRSAPTRMLTTCSASTGTRAINKADPPCYPVAPARTLSLR